MDRHGSIGRGARLACLAALAGFAAAPALAQDGAAPSQGRYDMHPSPGGVLRLDRITGEIALCGAPEGADAWTCRIVVEASTGTATPARDERTRDGVRARAEAARAAARARAEDARREAARRLDSESATDASGGSSATRPAASGPERTELDRLRQENARLTARVDELERRLAEVATVAGTGTERDAETDEAIADIDRAVRVGIYALARFRDLADVLSGEEPPPAER